MPNKKRAYRGNAKNRKGRKLWLLSTYGDGVTVECAMKISPKCKGVLDYESLTVDRYPVAGYYGGSYRRENIRPACSPCNSLHGAQLRWELNKRKK